MSLDRSHVALLLRMAVLDHLLGRAFVLDRVERRPRVGNPGEAEDLHRHRGSSIFEPIALMNATLSLSEVQRSKGIPGLSAVFDQSVAI